MIRSLLIFLAGALVAAALIFAKSFMSSTPASEYISSEAAQAAIDVRSEMAPHLTELLTGDINQRRAILDEFFFKPRIEMASSLYPVVSEPLMINGVYTEVFEPVNGIPEHNQSRVLINLHGGGFSMGARTEGRLESIPVANISGMKVISVDYRQGPENRFPAASEDVTTVYRHLLESYTAQQIGIFGCSAGGLLTAQSLAWFNAHELPMPGAIGIFCSGAGEFGKGDSMAISDHFGSNLGGDDEVAYLEDADWSDPLVAPLEHPKLLARFPASLLISGTRDFTMSGTLVTHQRMVDARVHSELHVYEGLGHYFFADTALPESLHVFKVIAEFFNRQLAAGDT